MKGIKWHRLPYFRIYTEYKGKTYIIGKDSGTMDLHTYYYIEVDGQVIMHGFTRQKDAKRYVEGYH